MSRPVFSKEPVFKAKGCLHPCLAQRVSRFVSNDLELSSSNSTLLLTGPNMGGKSTLLRQTAIAAIIAQVGSFVPADYIELSPFDRIFTRIGASDRLIEGKSTFFVEMEELKEILAECSSNSLAIVDELGRGTNTEDGMKVCKAALYFLTAVRKCFSIFTTHYHQLSSFCETLPQVQQSFMDCDVDEQRREIKFLYKLREGSCPRSFGVNVAKLAGLDESIVNRAFSRINYYFALI